MATENNEKTSSAESGAVTKSPEALKTTAKSPQKKSESDVLSKAGEYLNAGKRHLLVGDFSASVECLEESCKMLGERFGETAQECGESYFYYGKALLELARMEAGVIDNAFDGVNEESEAEDKEDSMVEDPKNVKEDEAKEISEKVDDALIENCEEAEKFLASKKEKKTEDKENVEPPNEEVVASKDGEKDEIIKKDNGKNDDKKKDDTESEESAEKSEEEEEEEAEGEGKEKGSPSEEKKETESIGSNDAGSSDVKETEDKVAAEKEEEDDPSNLQLSWEMLELAKGIISKHADSIDDAASPKRSELENRLSETYQLLGEVSIENENYAQAIEDLTSCLRRRQELLPADSRCIAETHYQLGVAKGFNLQFDEAVGSLEASIEVLESRVKNLKEKKESQDPDKEDDSNYSREKEVEEITKLIPEIKEKISDTRDMQEETLKKISETTGFGEAPSKDDKSAASDIKSTSSIMVKKRKKSVESAGDTADAKKPHLETNGTNGEKMEQA